MTVRSIVLAGAICIAIAFGMRPAAADGGQTVSTNYAIDPILASSPPPIDGNADAPVWKTGTHISLGWDLRLEGPAKDQTDVYLLDDARYLYVAFIAEQHGDILATQHTDDVGFDTDDEVQIDLWPGGDHGFQYLFTATPLGTHYAHSSENSNYSPKWISAGHLTPNGYEVTMRIPLDAMRGDGRKDWKVQFVRFETRSGRLFVWSHQAAQTNHNDVTFAGLLTGMQAAAASTRTKPRVALYSLASLASPTAGGSTSRAGADWAVPMTPTASFIGTVHPDYSNVDLDQQTISPTAFQRIFQEVRPFFTQGSSFYNPFDCVGCPGIQELYTPAIPTPRNGYAVEGTQGPLHFGTFDAVGAGRSDTAQSFTLTNPDRTRYLEFQRVSADLPGMHDDVNTYSMEYANHKNVFAYATYGQDRGTNVLDPTQGNREEVGTGWFGPKYWVGGAIRQIGAYYNPFDGIVQHPGIAGYNFNFDKWFNYTPTNKINTFEYYGSIDRYQGPTGGMNQTDQNLQVQVSTRNNYFFAVNSGSAYVKLANGVFSPVTLNGPLLGYRMHTSTPSQISYNAGRFGDGYVHSWLRQTTLPIGPRGTMQFEGDNTAFVPNSGANMEQWLEKVSVAYQLGPDASLAIGVRRIIGIAPPLGFTPTYVNASNLSFAFHRRMLHDELYLVYGDPNLLATSPAFILKVVHYFGADKGT
jgi:hypothetical protein